MRSPMIALIAAAAALSGIATPVSAQTAGDRADTRCILVLQLVGRDPKNKEAATQGIFYYLGRLQARGFSGKLDALMLAEAAAIQSQQQAQSEVSRCNTELTAHSLDLKNAFQRLQQQAQAARPQGAPAPSLAPAPKK